MSTHLALWPHEIPSTHVILGSKSEDSPGSFCLLQYGRTPLHLAANNGILDVVRYLCLTGANVEALTSVSSPLAEENDCKCLRPRGHEKEGIAWQLHCEADRLLLSFSSSAGSYVNICPHKPRVRSY